MATSSRQSALFGVNDWKAIYQTFREADFVVTTMKHYVKVL
jgi:hypothetical protein